MLRSEHIRLYAEAMDDLLRGDIDEFMKRGDSPQSMKDGFVRILSQKVQILGARGQKILVHTAALHDLGCLLEEDPAEHQAKGSKVAQTHLYGEDGLISRAVELAVLGHADLYRIVYSPNDKRRVFEKPGAIDRWLQGLIDEKLLDPGEKEAFRREMETIFLAVAVVDMHTTWRRRLDDRFVEEWPHVAAERFGTGGAATAMGARMAGTPEELAEALSRADRLELQDVFLLIHNARYMGKTADGARRFFDGTGEYEIRSAADSVEVLRKTPVPGSFAFPRNDPDAGKVRMFGRVSAHLDSLARRPAYAILEALGLLGIRFNRPPDETAVMGGVEIYTLELPPIADDNKIPTGLEILQRELAPVTKFKVVFAANHELIAVFPVLDDALRAKIKELGGYGEALNKGLEIFYLDLSDFYLPVPDLERKSPPDPEEKMACTMESMEHSMYKLHVYTYRSRLGETDEVLEAIQPQAFYRENYCLVGISPSGEADVQQMGAEEFLDEIPLERKPGWRYAVLPVFPGVYMPASVTASKIDKEHEFRLLAADSRFDLKHGRNILVVGPGCGIEAWAMSAWTGNKIYVSGINPLEVANTRFVSRLTGADVETVQNDGVLTSDGRTVFGKKFDRVVWDMPAVTSSEGYRPKEGGYFARFWDSDADGRTLARFAASLDKLLTDGGKALVWNLVTGLDRAIDEGGRDFVKVAFEYAGNIYGPRAPVDVELIDAYHHVLPATNEKQPVGWYLVRRTIGNIRAVPADDRKH